MKPAAEQSFWQKLAVRIPYAWLLAFFLVPFLIVLKISLSQTAIAQPPYTPTFDLAGGLSGVANFFSGLSLDNYRFLGTDPLYILSYVTSLQIAAFSTLLLLLIGYPIAYSMTRAPRRVQAILVVLVILPFWTSFLIRIYAWMNILQHDGPLNQLLMALHIVSEPPAWLSTTTAVYIGIVYSYLPFMVLPLYATLEKLDEQQKQRRKGRDLQARQIGQDVERIGAEETVIVERQAGKEAAQALPAGAKIEDRNIGRLRDRDLRQTDLEHDQKRHQEEGEEPRIGNADHELLPE